MFPEQRDTARGAFRPMIGMCAEAVNARLTEPGGEALQQGADPFLPGGCIATLLQQRVAALRQWRHLFGLQTERFDRGIQRHALQPFPQHAFEARPIRRQLGERQNQPGFRPAMQQAQGELTHPGLPCRQPPGQRSRQAPCGEQQGTGASPMRRASAPPGRRRASASVRSPKRFSAVTTRSGSTLTGKASRC